MNQIVDIERTADWLVHGSPAMRSAALIRCSRKYDIPPEKMAGLLADMARGKTYYEVRDFLLKETVNS